MKQNLHFLGLRFPQISPPGGFCSASSLSFPWEEERGGDAGEPREEGRGLSSWAWPHLRLELLWECILSQRRPAAPGPRGLCWEGWAAEFRASIRQIGGLVGVLEQSSRHPHPWCVSLLNHSLLFLNSAGERRDAVYWFLTTTECSESTCT